MEFYRRLFLWCNFHMSLGLPRWNHGDRDGNAKIERTSDDPCLIRAKSILPSIRDKTGDRVFRAGTLPLFRGDPTAGTINFLILLGTGEGRQIRARLRNLKHETRIWSQGGN
jgi:hypothetical protein